MSDPFDLSQYNLTFGLKNSYQPNAFMFADFIEIFADISEQIQMRQLSASIGYGAPLDSFANVQAYDTSTPSALSDALGLFQEAMIELVSGNIIDVYGKVPGCDVYIGFFHFASNGLPILGEINIAPGGAFSSPPDPDSITNILDFAKAVGEGLNEIIFALNVLTFTHGKMLLSYPSSGCGTTTTTTTTTTTISQSSSVSGSNTNTLSDTSATSSVSSGTTTSNFTTVSSVTSSTSGTTTTLTTATVTSSGTTMTTTTVTAPPFGDGSGSEAGGGGEKI